MKYIDWDNCDEEYLSDRDFWSDVNYRHNLKDLKESVADLHRPFAGYFDEAQDEAQRERNHKYEWDASHGLI